jgi:hypothetical protein
MEKDYYSRFQEFLSDTTIDDLLEATMGYQESSDGIKAVNEWVKQNAKSDDDFREFDEIFSCCLAANEALWFNMSWHMGWAAGVAQGLKAQGLDIPQANSCLAAIFNVVRHAGRIFQKGCSNG